MFNSESKFIYISEIKSISSINILSHPKYVVTNRVYNIYNLYFNF